METEQSEWPKQNAKTLVIYVAFYLVRPRVFFSQSRVAESSLSTRFKDEKNGLRCYQSSMSLSLIAATLYNRWRTDLTKMGRYSLLYVTT